MNTIDKFLIQNIRLFFLFIVMMSLTIGFHGLSFTPQMIAESSQLHQTFAIYLPIVVAPKRVTPFGIETNTGHLSKQHILNAAKDLGPSFLRIKFAHWRDIQPQQGAAFDWSSMKTPEKEIVLAQQANLTPVAIIHKNPDWAMKPYGQHQYAPCGAIAEEHFNDFATFMRELVIRYSQPPYNVHYWELGNEPDVDPSLLPSFLHEYYGCWGDIADPYYGGKHYGNMLKVVAPAMKQADPQAKILIGGLLLDSPNTTEAGKGKPENFLKGILEAGAGNSFDVVCFHTYPWFTTLSDDSDKGNEKWKSWGGLTIGKVQYIRQILSAYGMQNVPLFLNETALLLWDSSGNTADAMVPTDFLESQANHLVIQLTRSLSLGVEGFFWYTLHSSGWFSSGLLNSDTTKRPAYTAYKHYINLIGPIESYVPFTSKPFAPVAISDYGTTIEAYRFSSKDTIIDVLWSNDGFVHRVDIPTANVQTAYTRDGATLPPTTVGTNHQFDVGVTPIYIVRK